VRETEVPPSVRRREITFNRRDRRAPGWRLAALAAVSAVVLLPQTSSARGLASPSITPVIRGTAGSNGWYRSNVTVNWVIDPLPDSSSGCDAVMISVDTAGRHLQCSANWGAYHIDAPLTIKIDRAAPAVRAVAARPPDSNGWYNHAVGITFSGSDGMSGIAGCSAKTYAGPDSSRAVVPGGCTDRAGNSAGGSFALAYDSTPPQLKKLRAKHGNHSVIFKWQVSADTQSVVITRVPGKKKRAASSTVYSGKATSFRDKGLHVGTHYRYTVSVFDAAANKVRRTVRMTGTGRLFAPAPGASVKRAPRLEWASVRGASYYNVLVVRNGTIFSAWPKGTSLKLPRSWAYHGTRFRLHRGVYRWYVWPGFGARSANKYGKMVGRSSFFFAG
jgi:hypothetical protein